jgi:hypothetical protein
VFTDPVVASCDVEVAVIEKLGEDVDRDTGIGVALGVGVASSRSRRVRWGSCGD